VALRPGWQRGTLGEDLATTIEALAQVEIALAGFARETDAPQELVRRRDGLLARLKREPPCV